MCSLNNKDVNNDFALFPKSYIYVSHQKAWWTIMLIISQFSLVFIKKETFAYGFTSRISTELLVLFV